MMYLFSFLCIPSLVLGWCLEREQCTVGPRPGSTLAPQIQALSFFNGDRSENFLEIRASSDPDQQCWVGPQSALGTTSPTDSYIQVPKNLM